jgi:hypothetical protein
MARPHAHCCPAAAGQVLLLPALLLLVAVLPGGDTPSWQVAPARPVHLLLPLLAQLPAHCRRQCVLHQSVLVACAPRRPLLLQLLVLSPLHMQRLQECLTVAWPC